ncbi:biotin biosynthesis protein BioC [gut metagenome]|uniref:malonyl-[acyl-carrier protein] O-methyltransferase n=1 Tax=gut metagenome TaxID=749906 RepID=J9G340_9ZZZZ
MKSSIVRNCSPLVAEESSLGGKHPFLVGKETASSSLKRASLKRTSSSSKEATRQVSAETLIDKTLVNHRFSRVVESYHREAVAQRQIAERLVELLQREVGEVPVHPHLLEIGCGTGFLTRPLVACLQPGCLVLNDLCTEMSRCYDDWLSGSSGSLSQSGSLDSPSQSGSSGSLSQWVPGEVHFLAGDAETLLFPGGQDLIVSCSVLQWFTAPETFFSRCARLLKPDGYLAFSTFGGDNLKEVTALTGAGLTYRSLEEWKTLLAPHFEVVYAGEEHLTLTFDTPLEVLYHLKHTGVTAIRREAWTPGDLRRFCSRYTEAFGIPGDIASGGRAASERPASERSSLENPVSSANHAASGRPSGVPLTYHPLYILAKPRCTD